MTAGAAALLAEAAAAGARLEARLWCDAPDRLDRTLRDALAVQRPAVLRLLLDRPVGEGEATPAGTAAEGSAAPAPAPLHPNDDPEHQARLDGYQRAALRRPPSLPMGALPGMGCYCGCCAGQRWWCEREHPSGWRCSTCYPPDHLSPEAVRTLRT